MEGVRSVLTGRGPEVKIELQEYGSQEVALEPKVAALLARRHREHLRIETADTPGRQLITARQFVGTIRVEDVSILIRPKVRLENLLGLMDVEIPSETWSDEMVALERDPDLLSAMARLLCLAVEHLTRRGIRRSYVSRAEPLLSPRGRIDVAQLARRPALDFPVPCVFDDHTADMRLNQIVKAGLVAARRLGGIEPQWHRRLHRQVIEFEDVGAVGHGISWVPRWSPEPMVRHYETAVRLSHLILSGSSVRDRFGNTDSNSFLLNMNDLFEKWVTRRLAEAPTGHQVIPQKTTYLGEGRRIAMAPDVVFLRDGRVTAIADCKYKLVHDAVGRSSDYYQALAYATAAGLDESWLIYASFPGEAAHRDVSIVNSPVTVRTVGIDLTGSLADARSTVNRLAIEVTGKSRGVRRRRGMLAP